MSVKKKAKKVAVEVKVTETAAETDSPTVVEVEAPVVEATETAPEETVEKPILVAEAETPVAANIEEQKDAAADKIPQPTDNSQIFGPQPVNPPKPVKKLFWLIIIGFALLGALAGGVGIYLQNQGAPAPNPTPEVVASPTPTPVADLDKEGITIQVLNGSGVAGAAKVAQEHLEELGYTVAAVGNAESSDFTTTVIAVKADKKDYFPMLKKDLDSKYTVEDKADTLEEDADYDVVITLGAE